MLKYTPHLSPRITHSVPNVIAYLMVCGFVPHDGCFPLPAGGGSDVPSLSSRNTARVKSKIFTHDAAGGNCERCDDDHRAFDPSFPPSLPPS